MSDSLYAYLGAKVRGTREASRLTQVDLARRVGLSRSSVANIEAGRQAVYLHQAIILAAALGLPLSDLIPQASREAPSTEADEDRIRRLVQDSEDYVSDGSL